MGNNELLEIIGEITKGLAMNEYFCNGQVLEDKETYFVINEDVEPSFVY